MYNTHSPLIHSNFIAYASEPWMASSQGRLTWNSHVILWICSILPYLIIIWIKTGAISSFFHSDSSNQTIYKMKAFHKDECHQAIMCAGLWVTPSSESHSIEVIWQLIFSISPVVEKNGSLHHDKRTFTENAAIKKSLNPSGLKCPKEACPCCSVWVPEADILTGWHGLHRQPMGDMCKDPPRQKEVAASHWCRDVGNGGRGCFLHY